MISVIVEIYIRYKEVAEKKQWLMLSWCRVMDGF